MPSIHQIIFGGIKPAIDSENTQPQQGQAAHNVVLRDTTVRAVREPLASAAQKHLSMKGGVPRVPAGLPSQAKSIHMFPSSADCCAVGPTTFDFETSVLEAADPGSCPGFEGAVMFPCNCGTPYRYFRCEDKTYPLIVPQPVKAPRVVLVYAGTRKDAPIDEHKGPDQRTYTYTWVDRFGVESPPAPPSVPFLAWDDQTFDVSNFDAPPANAVCLRLYRAVSPRNLDPNTPIDIEGSFQLVEEIPLPAAGVPLAGGVFLDDRMLAELDFGTLTTTKDCPPPCMEQVVLTEEGRGVGFWGNQIHVSERHELHNWPNRLRVTLPDRIVGIVAFYDTVFVATTGRPYRINIQTVATGSSAKAETDAAANVLPYPQVYPCVSRHALVATSFGAMYPTRKGMVALAQDGGAVLISRDRVDEDDWSPFIPNIGVWHQGKYYGARSPVGNGFIMDIVDDGEGAGGSLDIGDLVTMDWNPKAAYSGPDGNLWYIDQDSRVQRWAAGDAHKQYLWQSKNYRMPGLLQMATAKVVGDYGEPVTLTILADGRVYDQVVLRDNEPVRLRKAGRGLLWSFRIQSATTVREVHIATSMAELSEP